jgi:two-component system sensor histidine kinase UhpB
MRRMALSAFLSGVRPGALLLGLLAILAGPRIATAQPQPQPRPIVIEQVVAGESGDGSVPAPEAMVPVVLPDRWDRSRPGYGGSVWYRTAFRLERPPPNDELVSLYVERACSNLQVRLNGYLIFSGGRMVDPVSRHCGRPFMVGLPAGLLRVGENTLELHVRASSSGRVASVRHAGGLSRLEVGTHSALLREHGLHYFWSATWTDAAAFVLIGIGCVLLAVGWLHRREVYFSHLGMLCLAWVGVSLLLAAQDLPWRDAFTEFLLVCLWPVLLAIAVQFFLGFAGLRSRALETLAAIQWVLVPLSLMVVGSDRLFVVARAWHGLLALELVGVMGIYVWQSTRRRPRDVAVVTPAALVGVAALLFELGVQWDVFEPTPVTLAVLIVPCALFVAGTHLLLMFARALRNTEADRNRLVAELQHLRGVMESRIAEQTARRVDEFGERERKRIASDLHDDLGAKLLMIIHSPDPASLPQLAREALDEMRLSVRGLAGRDVALDDAIGDWRAETVERLGQAGIEPRWQLASVTGNPLLSARSYMQLTRIVREAVTNVIRHSGARHCEVICEVVDNTLRLTVRDDGRGIVDELKPGQGLSSMKRRAKRLNGQCLVESYPGRGVVIFLTVPLS